MKFGICVTVNADTYRSEDLEAEVIRTLTESCPMVRDILEIVVIKYPVDTNVKKAEAK